MSLKNSMKKMVASLGIVSIVFSNFSLCGMGLMEVIAENTKIPEVQMEWVNEKYVQYQFTKQVEVEGQETEKDVKGVAVQSKLSVYPVYEQDTYIPTQSVEVNITLPAVNGHLPEKTVVVEASTESTTGKELNANVNQNYDSNSGLLTMSYENTPDENEKIYSTFDENAKDEFEIIYTYPAEAYTGNEEKIKIESSVNVKMTFKTESGNVSSEKTQSFETFEKDNKGDILTFDVAETEKIYKGFMYANTQNKTSYDTEYDTVSTFAVLNSTIVDEITMELKNSEFVLSDESKVLTDGKVLYKATQINKVEFDKILGQDGVLEIYTGETLLATVKYIEISENEEMIKRLSVIYSDGELKTLPNDEKAVLVEYKEDVSSLTIKTSKPIAEGFMNLGNQNIIKASNDYGCKVKDIKFITTEAVVNNYLSSAEIELLEPETKISVTSSNNNFSTLQNGKTTLTVTLDDTNVSTKLFNAPTITIKLPEGIVGGNLSSPEILNGNGLSIKNATVNNNYITIELEGKQTSYDLTNVSGGANIVMDIENIDYKDTIPTHEDKIEVICTQGTEKVVESCNVNIVSKSGLLVLSNVTGFDNNTVLTSIDSETKTVEVETNAEQKEVVQTINLVNNYDYNISNVQILGKIGYSSDKVTSTFNTELTKAIEVTNGKVYYSTKVDATYNDDTWTEEFTADAKAYKVELENNELASKNGIELKLHVKLPANLDYNQEIYLNCNVTYSNNEENIQDNVTIGMITAKDELTTNNNVANLSMMSSKGESVPVSLSISPIITQDYVHSGQLVTYKIRVSNDGQEDLNNLVLTSNISDNAIYTYYKTIDAMTGAYNELTQDTTIKERVWEISLLKAGEIIEKEMLITMADITEEQEVINSVSIKQNEQITSSSESKMILKPAKIHASLITLNNQLTSQIYKAGDVLNCYIKVKNVTDSKLNNIKVQYNIPEELKYMEGGITLYDEFEGYQITEEGTVNESLFEYNIENLEVGEEKVIRIIASVKQLTQKYEADLNTIAKVYVDDAIYETGVKIINIKQAAFNMVLDVDTKGKVILQKDDEVIYTITVKNIGENSGVVNITDQIPDNLKVQKIEYSINDEEKSSIEYVKQNIELSQFLDKNDVLILKITTKVKNIEVLEDTTLTVTNKATLKSGEIEINSNEVTIDIKLELKVQEDEEDVGNDGIKEDNTTDFGDNTENEGNNNEDDNYDDDMNDGSHDDNTGNNGDNEQNNGNGDNNNNTEDENTGKDDEEDKGGSDNGNDESDKEQESDKEETTVEKTYSISGVAWVDANKDGKKDDNETMHQGVKVSLVDMKTGNFAIDSNGNRITTTTDNQGKYIFENIAEGTYIIIFEIDTNTYSATTYKKENISEELNSDAILKKATIDGQEKLVGVTDNIELNSNKENIDIGLVENAVFDLSLNKQITKITVVTSKGTEVYEYNEEDSEMAKVDLVAKYMNGANVIVNYKFTVTNEGDISGYVNSLVDNLPTGLEFSSDLNKDWYKGSDGKLYTTALSKTEIKPGESKQIELVLIKNMTEDNAGIFPNSAELEKVSNLQNIQEKEENKENNQSSATLVISIKTGAIAMYIGITTLCLAIICIGIYFIKKKILNRGI